MNILFVYSVDDVFSRKRPLRTSEEIQFGISYISSLLKTKGHNTRLVVLSRMLRDDNFKILNKNLTTFRPQLVCFTAVTSEYRFIVNIAKYLRYKNPGIYQLIGGPHVSLNPQEAVKDQFDAICIGEGEYPTLELVTQLDNGRRPSKIANLWLKNNGCIEENDTRPFIANIDDLPFADRAMWDEWISDLDSSNCSILLGRGCPFECTYCCNHAFKKLAEGRYVRFRSIDNIMDEIRSLAQCDKGFKHFYLEIETIGANKAWALNLCASLERLNDDMNRGLSFGTNLRITPEADLEGLFMAFKRSNFRYVKVGIESGNERIRRDVLNRNYSNEDILKTVRLAKKYGLSVYTYNIIGVPGETAADFNDTIRLNRECLPDKTYAHIFFPYPGTRIHQECAEKGLLNGITGPELERCRATLDLPGFKKKEIQKNFIWFDYNVYKGLRPIRNILAKVFVSMCRSSIRLHYLYRMITLSSLFRLNKRSIFTF